MKKLILLVMGVLLLLYGNVSSARNPDITATPYAMARINNLKANDFQKIPGRSSSNPYYALKDTYRARFIAGLPGFEYQNIASSTLTPSVKSYSFDFAQMSYNLNNDKGICSSFTSAVSRTTLGNLKVGTKMLKGSKLKQGTILTTKPKAGGSGHIVLLMKVRKKYIWVLDQNAYYHEAGSNNPRRGIIGLHKLFFKKGKINSTDMGDARNYYTMYKKRGF